MVNINTYHNKMNLKKIEFKSDKQKQKNNTFPLVQFL